MSLYSLLEPQKNLSLSSVTIAVVTNNKDPKKLGRVKVKYPTLSEQEESDWARIVSFMAGNNRGAVFLPEVGDEVLVAFAGNDINAPYVLGSLWNGKDKPPFANDDGNNDVRVIRSRSGHVVEFHDKSGEESIKIIDKTTKNKIVIDSKTNKITLEVDKDIEIKAPNGKVLIQAKQLEIKTSDAAQIEAGADLDLQAGGNANVAASTINLN